MFIAATNTGARIANLLIEAQTIIYLLIIVGTGIAGVVGLIGTQGGGGGSKSRAVKNMMWGIVVLVLFIGMRTWADTARDTFDEAPVTDPTPVTIG